MLKKLEIVKIDYKYCNYLRKVEPKVPYNAGSKELRPFIGVLFAVDNGEYFAPLSSPKPKHLDMKNQLDLIKIDDGKLGVVNLNNMIPVQKSDYDILDLNLPPKTASELKRQVLLKKQLRWLNRNIGEIQNKSKKLYELYNQNLLPRRIKERCCNFMLLEEKCFHRPMYVK